MLIFRAMIDLIVQVNMCPIDLWEQLQPMLQALANVMRFVQGHFRGKDNVNLNQYIGTWRASRSGNQNKG